MKTKLLFIVLATLLSLAACDKDNTPLLDNPPTLSYFKGFVNDKYTVFEQKVWYDTSIDMRSITTLEGSILQCHWYMVIPMENKDTVEISTTLSPLQIGRYKLTPVKDYGDFYSEIRGYLSSTKGQYRLSQHNPFLVTIEAIDYRKERPDITGYMEGVLYNKDNPKDSIVLKDINFRVIPHY